MKILSILLIAGVLFVSYSCNQKKEVDSAPKNIILVIADGYGLGQAEAFRRTYPEQCLLHKFPYVGLQNTSSATDTITDSGAAGTAMACGQKTYSGAIGVDTDTLPMKNLTSSYKQKGKKTGVIASCAVTHATPAAFVAHQPQRSMQENIAYDYFKSDVDVVIGGGLQYFNEREDGKVLSDSIEANGYTFYTTLQDVGAKDEKFYCLVADGHPDKAPERGSFLSYAFKKSLPALENDEGFFLMIEHSQIDWAGHGNDSLYLIEELKDLNKLMQDLLVYVEYNENTLLILTGDHETGGLVVTGSQQKNNLRFNFNTGGHTAILVPLYAKGPGANNFSGVYQNEDIYHRLLELTP